MLTNLIDLVLYIPSWFPGAQFKRDAKGWKELYVGTREYLYQYVKKRKVRGYRLKTGRHVFIPLL